MPDNWPDYILAVGALGTAAFAIVDASKAFWGGISNSGFGKIRRVIERFFSGAADDAANPLSLESVLATLRANWLNGTALADQKAIAKTLIKLRLDANNAARLAQVTGVDQAVLASVATSIADGTPLTTSQNDVLGRFDVITAALLDQGYERADQIYRNSARVLAMSVSIVLAFFGGWIVYKMSWDTYVGSRNCAIALLTGLFATPLAPVSKDLARGLQAAMKAVSLARGGK